jgi:hypothetical protein
VADQLGQPTARNELRVELMEKLITVLTRVYTTSHMRPTFECIGHWMRKDMHRRYHSYILSEQVVDGIDERM